MPNSTAAQTLRASRLFQVLNADELDDIAAICRVESVPSGTWLFHSGDVGDSLWVVINGAVEVLMEGSPPQSLAMLGPHDVLGELSLIEADRRSASARTTVDTQLLRMDHSEFAELRESLNPAAHKFMRELAKVVCGRIRDVNERISLVAAEKNADSPLEAPTSQRKNTITELLKKLWSPGEPHG